MAAQGPSRRRVSTQPSIRPAGKLRQVANRAAGGTASIATGLFFFFSVFQRKKSKRKERAEKRGRRRTRRRACAPTRRRTRGRNGAHPNIGPHPWGRGAPPRRSSPEEEEEEREGRSRWTRRRIGQTKRDARCNSERAQKRKRKRSGWERTRSEQEGKTERGNQTKESCTVRPSLTVSFVVRSCCLSPAVRIMTPSLSGRPHNWAKHEHTTLGPTNNTIPVSTAERWTAAKHRPGADGR